MISSQTRFRQIAVFEMAGFCLILFIILMDELFDLPHILFGAPKSPVRMEEYLIEGIALFCFGAAVIYFSYRAARKIRELEAFLTMCAWCRRIRINSEWVHIEEYVKIKDKLRTTHGICQDCAREMTEEMKAKKKT